MKLVPRLKRHVVLEEAVRQFWFPDAVNISSNLCRLLIQGHFKTEAQVGGQPAIKNQSRATRASGGAKA